MSRFARAAWVADAAAGCAAFGALLTIGAQPFGALPPAPGTTTALVLVWVVTAVAVGVVALARPVGVGVVALALAVPGLATVDTSSVVRVVAVAAGAGLALALAVFVRSLLGGWSGAAVIVLGTATIVDITARIAVRDPFLDLRCAPYCRDNPLLVAARPGWVLGADRALAIVTLGWCIVAVVQLARSRASIYSRASAAVAVAAAAIASLIGLTKPGLMVWSDPTAVLPALVPGLLIPSFLLAAQPAARVWLTRLRARKLVTALAESFGADGVAGRLRQLTRDRSVRLLYSSGPNTYLGADAQPAARDTRWAATAVERDGETIAVIEHEPSSTAALAAALTPAVTMAVENERLRVLATSELDELRASRRRIVERADATRRRLERDLHDGAQQRLLLLGMELSRAAENAEDGERERYVTAIARTQEALAELRHLVSERLPPVLDELGLVEALRSLADTSPVPLVVEVDPSLHERPDATVEHAAYALSRSMIDHGELAGASKVAIRLSACDGRFTVVLRCDAVGNVDVTDDEDRVGAVGGSLVVTGGADGVEYVASFP
ncbi:MAG: histidine kinase [Acidimicrobiales bacterium]